MWNKHIYYNYSPVAGDKTVMATQRRVNPIPKKSMLTDFNVDKF